jgi:hypothetical protein
MSIAMGLVASKCHPEFISGSHEMLKHGCPEEILNQVQNDMLGLQHDKKKKRRDEW